MQEAATARAIKLGNAVLDATVLVVHTGSFVEELYHDGEFMTKGLPNIRRVLESPVTGQHGRLAFRLEGSGSTGNYDP